MIYNDNAYFKTAPLCKGHLYILSLHCQYISVSISSLNIFVCVQHAVVYAGAQKNVGCAGVTVIIGMCMYINTHFILL